MLALVYFIIFAVIAVGGALCVFFTKHPLYGAISLIVTMLSLAGIYGLVGSPFVGVVQIMVYTGAVMTLLLFIIMVLNGARDNRTRRFDKTSIFVVVSVIALAVTLAFALCHAAFGFDAAAVKGTVAVTAGTLFDVNGTNGYYLLLEAIGLILLSSMATAVILARKRIASDPEKENSEEAR